MGAIEIGFSDSPSNGFQNILFNIVAVRLNPSTDAAVPEGDPNWVTISAPPGLGAVGELQIDITPLQDNAKLFNTASVPAQTYNQIEVLIDQINPGTIVPSCALTGLPVSEGCVSYAMKFSSSANLRTTAAVTVSAYGLTPVILDFGIDLVTNPPVPPPVPGGAYIVTPIISVATTNFVGAVAGTATGGLKPTTSTSTTTGASVVAELAGTNTIIAAADVLNGTAACGAGGGNCFTLQLPAAAPSGTAYDLYLHGGGVNSVAVSGLVVVRGGSITYPFDTTVITASATVSGTIADKFTGTPIEAATVNLLIPSTNDSNIPVVVDSVATDSLGNYSFPAIPSEQAYTLTVSASGFDPVSSTLDVPKSGSPTCGPSKSVCSFSLPSTTISGTVSIDTAPPSGHNVQVHVMAQDAGTGNLENDVMVTIPSLFTSAPFTIRVPTSPSNFDLIASSSDLYLGVPDPFTGHSIAVLSNVPGGSSVAYFGQLDCLGHGSISGTAASPDSETTVRLFQLDGSAPVQLGETQVGASGSSIAGQFSFCVPPGTYNLQRYENGSAVATATGIVVPTPAPFHVPTPAPSSGASPTATATPCPSVCGNSSTCPGFCSGTLLDSPL